MAGPILQTSDLENSFRALRNRDPQKLSNSGVSQHPDYKRVPSRNYSPTSSVDTGSWGSGSGGMTKTAAGDSGIVYGQPQFFSPVHTPINWQIPSKRLEQYQWSRFFYHNEPKVASAIDFYAYFPMSDWTHDCSDARVKSYFDDLKKRLDLPKWCRLISHEVHLLGDCFPFQEISCDICGGTGRVGDEICEHEGGTVRRIVILNPDYVEVYTSPLNPDPQIALKPNEELIDMVQRQTPGYDQLTPEVAALVQAGQPIPLDNRNVGHIKYGECPYTRWGVGMVRRLFPILSYKTKLMVAQWVVAERLIVPIKVVKVGSDERPAGPADIADVQAQLAQTANDPNLTIVTHHNFELDWYGAAGKVLTLSNEFELINQEVLDGMMINNALLNGEGPNFSSAAVGIEAMITRLETFRQSISQWIEEEIYLPEAKRQGFIEENPHTGEPEYIVPTIKWNKMHLRDTQQDKQFALQLHEKGLLSAQTVLEVFGYDSDMEIERKRYDSLQMMALGQGFEGQEGGEMGGMGDAGGMGGMPPMGGGGDMGGGGEAPIEPGGGDMGGGGGGEPPAPTGGAPTVAKSTGSFQTDVVDPNEFGGKVLKKKTREKIESERQKMYNREKQKEVATQNDVSYGGEGGDGQSRDEKGRIVFTEPERELISHIVQSQKDGIIKYRVIPQFRIQVGSQEYPVDFAIAPLKIAIEADGETFHGSPKQIEQDKERDGKLGQQGWTVLRFTDREIKKRPQEIVQSIVKTILKKEMAIKNNAEQSKSVQNDKK